MSDESRLHLLNNGATDRQKKKVASQNATVGEVNEAIQRLQDESERMVRWYVTQLPELVARMVADAMIANKLTEFPPQPVWDVYRAAGHTAESDPDGHSAQAAVSATDDPTAPT